MHAFRIYGAVSRGTERPEEEEAAGSTQTQTARIPPPTDNAVLHRGSGAVCRHHRGGSWKGGRGEPGFPDVTHRDASNSQICTTRQWWFGVLVLAALPILHDSHIPPLVGQLPRNAVPPATVGRTLQFPFLRPPAFFPYYHDAMTHTSLRGNTCVVAATQDLPPPPPSHLITSSAHFQARLR